MKKEGNKRKQKRENLGDNEKEQLRKFEKKGKKVVITLRDNLHDEKKNHFKKEDKRKQEKRGNFDDI